MYVEKIGKLLFGVIIETEKGLIIIVVLVVFLCRFITTLEAAVLGKTLCLRPSITQYRIQTLFNSHPPVSHVPHFTLKLLHTTPNATVAPSQYH